MLQCDLARSFRQPLLSLACAVALACTDAGDPLGPASSGSNSVTVQSTGDLYILLQTDPLGASQSFSFTHDVGANSGNVVPSPFTLADGSLQIFNGIVAGSYTVTETVPPGWSLGTAADGTATGCLDDQGNSSIDLASGVATVDVAAGEFVVCTFVNRKRATLSLQKRESGALPLSAPWSFELRTGASEAAAGDVRATGAANAVTGEVTFSCTSGTNPDCAQSGGVVWLSARQYQLCEVGMPSGSSNNLDGFTPAGGTAEGGADATECVNLTLALAESATTLSALGVEFIDNVLASGGGDPPPPVAPRTISMWRNQESCSTETAGRNGPGASSGGALELYLPSHPAVFPLGLIASMNCDEAQRTLSRQDLSGGNRASDAAYTLAAQLFAARLNQAAGAPVPECVAEVMSSAQELLGAPSAGVGFTGTGDYLGPKSDKNRRAAATGLAGVLDRYNSGAITVAANNCG